MSKRQWQLDDIDRPTHEKYVYQPLKGVIFEVKRKKQKVRKKQRLFLSEELAIRKAVKNG